MANPMQTRHEVRVKLGVLHELAAEVFVLIVFMCDDLLRLKPAPFASASSNTAGPSLRFFVIASKLPMELQMILCHRVVGSAKQNILHEDSEAACKFLAGALYFHPRLRATKKLYDAVTNSRVLEVEALLKDDPDLDVNLVHAHFRKTALHVASISGHVEVVKVLLAHSHINVNLKDMGGSTSFSCACEIGCEPVVRLLLKDPRVDVTLADDAGCTPLWRAAHQGQRRAIEWLIASGRDLGENMEGMRWEDCEFYTALEIARLDSP